MSAPTRYAVLMGDLVASSGAASRRVLHGIFNRAIKDANGKFAADLASPLTITLGDEYQGLTRSLSAALEVSHYVRLTLLLDQIGLRCVIGLALIETEVNPERAWNMMGVGLPEARRKLGDKKSANCYRFSFPHRPELEMLLDAVGKSLTRIETGWTDTQLAYVWEVLSHPGLSRAEVAARLKVSENSLYKVLRSADFRLYSELLETVRTVLSLEDRNESD